MDLVKVDEFVHSVDGLTLHDLFLRIFLANPTCHISNCGIYLYCVVSSCLSYFLRNFRVSYPVSVLLSMLPR